MRSQTPAARSSLITAATPALRKQNSSSACLNAGLTGTTTAPSAVIAWKLATNQGSSGSTSATASPGPIPRRESPLARRSIRSTSSAKAMRSSR